MKKRNVFKMNSDAGSSRLENVIIGTNGGDWLYGGKGIEVDRIMGMDGEDHIFGLGGNDWLYGGDGYDEIEGGAGDDHIFGGDGDDWIDGNDGNDVIHGEAGDDDIQGRTGSRLYGDAGDDRLTGTADYYEGGKGDDSIYSRKDTTIKYNIGDGYDKLYLRSGHHVIQLGEGIKASDIRFGTDLEFDEDFIVYWGEERIMRIGNWSDETEDVSMEFTDGTVLTLNEMLKAVEGRYNGTEEDDVYNGSNVNVAQKIIGDGGDDTLTGGIWGDLIEGGTGNDKIYGGAGDDELQGDDGDDRFFGGEGDDWLQGDDGDDRFFGGEGDDWLLGGEGDDYYEGGAGADDITDKSGNAHIKYNLGDGYDLLRLGDGRHVIQFGKGIKTSDLRFGSDLADNEGLLVYSNERAIIRIKGFVDEAKNVSMEFEDGTVLTPSEILQAIEGRYEGTEKDDVYNGSDVDISQNLVGNEGNDTLTGGSWGDLIEGGEGNDHLYGNKGDDSILGGDGDDYLYGNEGNDYLEGDRYDQTGNDYLYGGEGDDELRGGKGVDHLYGGVGDDTLNSDDDGNYFEGGKGNDEIRSWGDKAIIKYNRGDGFDTVKWENAGNVIRFGEGIEASDVHCTFENKQIHPWHNTYYKVFDVYLNEEKIMMINEFSGPSGEITMEFTDGTVLTTHDIYNDIEGAYYGTENDDVYDGTSIDVKQEIDGNGGDDTLKGGKNDDNIDGGSGNDIIEGNDGKDYIVGGYGNDKLYGGAGNDKLLSGKSNKTDTKYYEGGTGNDYISVSCGDGIIAYSRGDGMDTIEGINGEQKGTIQFGEGIAKEDIGLVLGYASNDMDLTLDGSKIMNIGRLVDKAENFTFEFADGSSLTVPELFAPYNWKFGTESNDVIKDGNTNNIIYGLYGNDEIYGEEGDDELHGNNGRDKLYGGEGDDYLNGGFSSDDLWGGNGNDTLKGSRGNDNLYGEAGDDTYLIGKRTYVDYITESSGQDTVAFEKFYKAKDAVVDKDGDDLKITFGEISSKVVVKDYFKSEGNKIEHVTFEDGTVWDQATLESKIQTQQLTQAMAGFSPAGAVGSVAVEEPVKGMELQLAAAI